MINCLKRGLAHCRNFWTRLHDEGMIKLGRYRVYFTRYYWMQPDGAVLSTKILFMTVYREVRPSDVDKKKRFPLGTDMKYAGRRYRYWKAGEDIGKGKTVGRYEVKQ